MEDWLSDQSSDGFSVSFNDIEDVRTKDTRTYHEKNYNGLIDDFKEGISVFDEETYRELNNYIAYLEEIIAEEKTYEIDG